MSATPNSGLRIVFFGTPEFASHILDALVAQGERIVGVVTTPEKPKGRGLHVTRSAVHESALRSGISVLTPAKHRDPDFLGSLAELKADIFVVVAYKILPREVFAMPRLGSFNVHASLLPKYRGAAPINWAIIRGEKETGITTFLLDDAIDTGSTLLQYSVPITNDETAGELHDTLMALGATAAHETLLGLGNGTLKPQPQIDTESTTAPKIFPADCNIDFNRSPEEVHNFVRGLSPYPAAYTTIESFKVKILRTAISSGPPLAAGTYSVSPDGKRLFAGTRTTVVEILELQREGRKRMTSEEFLRGNRALFQ